MKAYKVEFTERAVKDLRKLDKYTRNLIVAWIEKNPEKDINHVKEVSFDYLWDGVNP